MRARADVLPTATLAALLLATPSLTCAQEAADARRPLRVGVLDVRRVEAETALGREFAARADRVHREAESREQALAAAQRSGASSTEDVRRERLRLRRDTERRLEHLRTALRQRLRPFMNRTVRERRLDLTLDARFVVYASHELDISDEVIARAAAEEIPAEPPDRE